MASATQNVIEAANQTGATIVFPGNVYSFGNTKQPIREDSPPQPDTRKGQLRLALETRLETAALVGPCRVINVRLPDFWGPNVIHVGIAPVFEGALLGKAMPWLMNADIPHQSVYTPDAAEIIARLMGHTIYCAACHHDTKVRSLFPDFRETPMIDALTTTLDWFAQHRLNRPANAVRLPTAP